MVKSSVTIQLDDKVRKELEKRAKKELLDLDDLINEILRRSVISYKKGIPTDNIDDKFLSYFTRKQKVDYVKKLKNKLHKKKVLGPFYEGIFR